MNGYAVLNGNYDPEDQEYRWVKLALACDDMGVEQQGQAHRALGDALTTAALIRAVTEHNWTPPAEAPPGMFGDYRD